MFAMPTAVLACACCVGCAGNGEGLDQNGRPVGEQPPPLVAEFQSIQDNVFTPICTTCHAGGAAPLGLSLEDGVSYALLVNTPSVEVPSLNRVTPGDPDSSYLVQKIEGHAAVGDRMPLGGPPLPDATIAVIRQWIAEGAQPPAAGSTDLMSPTKLAAADPLPGRSLDKADSSVVVVADGELDTTRLDAGTMQVEMSGGDGRFDDGNEVALPGLQIELRSLAPTVFAISARGGWPDDVYRLTIHGDGPDPLLDRSGTPIDGDRDGIAGGDFTLDFDARSTQ